VLRVRASGGASEKASVSEERRLDERRDPHGGALERRGREGIGECLPAALVIQKNRLAQAVQLGQKPVQGRRVAEPPVGVAGALPRERQNMQGTLGASRKEHDAKSRPVSPAVAALPDTEHLILVRLIGKQFRADIRGRVAIECLGAAIELHQHVESSPGEAQLNVTVRRDTMCSRFQQKFVLSVKLINAYSVCVSADMRMHNRFGQIERVGQARGGQLAKITAVRQHGIRSPHDTVAFGREFVIIRQPTSHDRQGESFEQLRAAECLQPFPRAALVAERFAGPGDTGLDDECRGQRRPIEQLQQGLITRSEMHCSGINRNSCQLAGSERTIRAAHFRSPRLKKPGYIDVDALQAQTMLVDAAAKCGIRLDSQSRGSEVRIDCPFSCPGDHAGRREVSISTDNPQKVFYCHAYQCQLRGNLLTLMHGWLTGQRPAGDKLKGAEFNRVKQVLASEITQTSVAVTATLVAVPNAEPPATEQPAKPTPSVPLGDSDDANIRALATLDEKLLTDVAAMHPAAASYVRYHKALSSESLQKWRSGYLPLDGGGDKRGWSLRGHIVYPMLSEDGKVLAWIGRDPAYEEKEREFQTLIPTEREQRKPPQKHKVPAGFPRGNHFFGQQSARLREPGYREFIVRHGLIIVEGFNDVIGLDNLGIPALGLCSNRLTVEQAAKLEQWARQLANGKVVLIFDCDQPGDDGAKEAMWLLVQRGLDVRLGWCQATHAGKHGPHQPEDLSWQEWQESILPRLHPRV
jgi:5S rRNA maturation endonuclease (ribonuclease M5)